MKLYYHQDILYFTIAKKGTPTCNKFDKKKLDEVVNNN